MYTYRITVSYDGTRYRGWQRQQNTDQTIQSLIEQYLKKILGYTVRISGSGRTDSGVHAFAQEASVRLPEKIDIRNVQTLINRLLPEDIRVIRICPEEKSFHARLSACGKCYEYRVDLREKPEVFFRKYRMHFPHRVEVAEMEKAAKMLTGKHDFTSFTDLKDSDDTVRTVYRIEIENKDEVLLLRFFGDGFLYHMVRILTGTLLDVGCGKIPAGQMLPILAARDRSWAGFPAPAKGLALKEVYYNIEEMEAKMNLPEAEKIAERVKIF